MILLSILGATSLSAFEGMDSKTLRLPLHLLSYHNEKHLPAHPDFFKEAKITHKIKQVLRADATKENHFFLPSYHIHLKPLGWHRKHRFYRLEATVYHRHGPKVEEKLATMVVSGHLQFLGDFATLDAKVEKTVWDKFSKTLHVVQLGHADKLEKLSLKK
jgi:hypothetical protein